MKVEIRLRYERVFVWTVETEEEAEELSRMLGRDVQVGEKIEGTDERI